MSNEDYCDFCKGMPTGSKMCVYCNGTGEWNQTAQAYLKNHICQCIFFDRKFCPVCHKKCHHDASLSPKQKIDPGWGGDSKSFKVDTQTQSTKEELIIV
jgi:DnaJ-class molecular chaperone